MQASNGSLYVTSSLGGINDNGTIVQLNTSGQVLSYYQFPGMPGGALPGGPLLEAADGNFYSTTLEGGNPGTMYGWGTFFRMTPEGEVSILYSFCPNRHTCPDGYYPGSLISASDGYFYGLAGGGANGLGTIFRINTSGKLANLYSFTSEIGQNPVAIMQETNGQFYGSAYFGGPYTYGAIFNANFGLPPFIQLVSSQGSAGQTAEILGQNLIGATSVTFNGIPATRFSVASEAYMTAVIPQGATSGPVVVTTPKSKLTSNVNFRISK